MTNARVLFALVGAWSALAGCTAGGSPAGSTLDSAALECLAPSDADLAAVQRLVAVATPGERLSGVRSVPLGNGYSLVAARESGSRDGASGSFAWSVDTVWVTNGAGHRARLGVVVGRHAERRRRDPSPAGAGGPPVRPGLLGGGARRGSCRPLTAL